MRKCNESFFIAALVALSLGAAQPPAGGTPRKYGKSLRADRYHGLLGRFVTEDWRFRMVTPRKGDYQAVPMTEQARKVADAWDPAADEAAGNQCKAYGAAAIMRVAARFHITWQDDNTLRVDSDSGMQTRLFHFNSSPPPAGRADVARLFQRAVAKTGVAEGSTTNLRSGYLRKNGVPYSENAAVTEYFDIAPLPGGGQVLLVTSDRRRSAVSAAAVYHEFAIQEGGRRFEMGSNAMHAK
jgi:hypothetical protein